MRARLILSIGLVLLSAAPAFARLPRGAQLSAAEQTADEATGITIARGNAELLVQSGRIRGAADVIEVRPKLDEVLFKGRASVTVSGQRYESDTVACTLDFMRCTTIAADQDLPALPASTAGAAPATATATEPAAPAAAAAGNAAITPR